MYKASPKRKEIVEKSKSVREKEIKQNSNFFAKHLKRIYPITLQRSTSSSFSLSSISLSLSQNSTDSVSTDSNSTLEQKISLALGLISSPHRREIFVPKSIPQQLCQDFNSSDEPKRCNWITKKSDEVYVMFHDQQWGVPVYDDNLLFEFLAMSGMLMDYNWTEILKRKEHFREAFCEFDPNRVAKMGEKEIAEIASNKAIMLQESRVVNEFGSFSSFVWGFMDYKPIINKFKYSRNVPLRSPKAEIISKDMIKRGFRFVGPVIVHSFMQAAGLTIDHLVDCFRHGDCVSLAERPWRHI
ncbi:Contains similarity to a putative DNA-3-methyladenine glycosylase I F9E10.6 gi/6646756 from Arabidopsis thaliana BAC F9E10 gb/AC013258 [Arabidopsis thaliana]|uniref:F21F23.7 protein n=1 Tax=Arabidopsis thaliana TaxID=3702 RepID=Q9LMY4_ARATH|nr:Contains similarity to a putative DNA-3-methyladenine glycosylase I F9E10.6 gi/6646756 from Arabidopsis thaliana BAC F9E10 gb/AC013258 [Arabidopsis thaliana]